MGERRSGKRKSRASPYRKPKGGGGDKKGTRLAQPGRIWILDKTGPREVCGPSVPNGLASLEAVHSGILVSRILLM